MAGMAADGPAWAWREWHVGVGRHANGLNDVPLRCFPRQRPNPADPEIVRVERGGRIPPPHHQRRVPSSVWVDLGRTRRPRGLRPTATPYIQWRAAGFPIAMAQALTSSSICQGPARFRSCPTGSTGRQTGIVLATPGARIPRIADSAQAAPAGRYSLEARLTAGERCRHAPRICRRSLSAAA